MEKSEKKAVPAKKKVEKPAAVQAVIANCVKAAEKAATEKPVTEKAATQKEATQKEAAQNGVVKWGEAVNTLPYYLL